MARLRSSVRSSFSLPYKVSAFFIIMLGFFLTLNINSNSDEQHVLGVSTNSPFGVHYAKADAYTFTYYATTPGCS